MKNLFQNEPRNLLVCLLILFTQLGYAQTLSSNDGSHPSVPHLNVQENKMDFSASTVSATIGKVAEIELSPFQDKDQIDLYADNLSSGAPQAIPESEQEFGPQEELITLEEMVVTADK